MGKGSEHNDLIAYGPHREPAVSSVAESPQLIELKFTLLENSTRHMLK